MKLDIDLNIRIVPSDHVPAWALALIDSVSEIANKLGRIQEKEVKIMTTLADIQAKAAATLASVTAETSVVNAVKVVVDNSNALIATLKQQLADAIAAGADPVLTQTLSDTIDAIQAAETSNAAVVAAAVVAGTPAAAV